MKAPTKAIMDAQFSSKGFKFAMYSGAAFKLRRYTFAGKFIVKIGKAGFTKAITEAWATRKGNAGELEIPFIWNY